MRSALCSQFHYVIRLVYPTPLCDPPCVANGIMWSALCKPQDRSVLQGRLPRRIPGPAGLLMEATDQGLQVLSLSDLMQETNKALRLEDYPDVDFLSGAWQTALQALDLDDFDGLCESLLSFPSPLPWFSALLAEKRWPWTILTGCVTPPFPFILPSPSTFLFGLADIAQI